MRGGRDEVAWFQLVGVKLERNRRLRKATWMTLTQDPVNTTVLPPSLVAVLFTWLHLVYKIKRKANKTFTKLASCP